MRAPGASSDRLGPDCEKQVILSAAIVSVHLLLPDVYEPEPASYTAPTLTAPGAHAGSDRPFWKTRLPAALVMKAKLPAATTGSTPAVLRLAKAEAANEP